MNPSLIPWTRRTLAMTRLTPSAMDTAVSVLATLRPRRYLRATVRIVIGRRRHSCGPVVGSGAIELDHVDDLISTSERGVIVRDEEQGSLLLPADSQKGGQDLPGRP